VSGSGVSGPAEGGAAPPARRRDPRRLVADVAVVLGAGALLGLLAGVLLPQLADPVTVTRTANGLVRDEVALSEQFDVDGWYSVLAAVGGLLLGAVMLAWRRTDEVVTLLAAVAGAFLASWLSAAVALALGPDDPTQELSGAADGATAPAALALTADVVHWVWPLFAVLGALLYLISPLSERPIEEAVAQDGGAAATSHGGLDVSGPVSETPPTRP
jgi:hypothetical protein